MQRLATGLLCWALAFGATADNLRVATAANFKPLLQEIVSRFEKTSPHRVILSSASTGVLYTQIIHGAPFDILLAADAKHPRLLEEAGYAVPGQRRTYAVGQLVLAYRGSLAPLASAGPGALLSSPGLSLVIANPAHAPYGLAAAAVLKHKPLAADSRLLQASNVGQAYQMWFSGGVDAALVARSFLPAQYLEIPAGWYPPLEQQVLILGPAQAKAAAREFVDFLLAPPIQQLIADSGYGAGVPVNG